MMEFQGVGSEQSGVRPGIVVQNDVGNRYSPNVIVVPMTTKKKHRQPTHVWLAAKENGLPRDSTVLCENPERMSKTRLGAYVTHLPDETMKKVATAYLTATSLVSFLDRDELLFLWEQAKVLNS